MMHKLKTYRRYLVLSCMILFLVIGVVMLPLSTQTPENAPYRNTQEPPSTITTLGDGNNGIPPFDEDPPNIERQELKICIKTISGNIETLRSVDEFEVYDKSQIKWILIENKYGYFGYAMSGALGHGEVIVAPKCPSYTLDEPLYGIFLQAHFKYADTWYTRYLTSNEWGVDFRQTLQLEETLWGLEHKLWELSYSATVNIGPHVFEFSVGIKVSTCDLEAKIYSTIKPTAYSYQNFGFAYILVENPASTIPERFKINYIKFNNGTQEKIVSAHIDRDIVADAPNHLLYAEALNTDNPAYPYYLYRWDFNDLRSSGLGSLEFKLDEATLLPGDKTKPTLQVGGRYLRAVAQNELIYIDPLINTDPESADIDDSAATFDGTFVGMTDTNEKLQMKGDFITEQQTTRNDWARGDTACWQEVYLEAGEQVTSFSVYLDDDDNGGGTETITGHLCYPTRSLVSSVGSHSYSTNNDGVKTFNIPDYTVTNTGMHYLYCISDDYGDGWDKNNNSNGYRNTTYEYWEVNTKQTGDLYFVIYAVYQIGDYISTSIDGGTAFDWTTMDVNVNRDGAIINLYTDSDSDNVDWSYTWTLRHTFIADGNTVGISVPEDAQYFRYKIEVSSGGTGNTWIDDVITVIIAGAAPTIHSVSESTIATDPFMISADITDISGVDIVLISYWHSIDNGTLDAWSLLAGSNFTMVLESGITYTNNSCTLAGCLNEPYIKYTIYAKDSVNNWEFYTGYYLFDEGVTLSNLSIRNNERLGFVNQKFSVDAEQITAGVGIEITTVKFRYTYENPVNQYEIYSTWITMNLVSGTTEFGTWKGSFAINDTYFDEDDDYKLQVRAENSNGLLDSLEITFYADSTPESGITLGRLNQISDEIRCGNYTDDIAFSVILTFAESHLTYTKTIQNTQWESRLIDFNLITAYSCTHQNITDITITKDTGVWKLKLRFSEAPEEDSTTTIVIYEKEPQLSNPTVVNVGKEDITYSLDISTERTWANVHIGDQIFPSDPVKQAWWANYKIKEYTSWKLYADSTLKNELEAIVTVWADPNNEYKAHMDIQGLDLTVNITTLYIKGTLSARVTGFRLNITALLMAFLLPFGGYCVVLITEATGRDINTKLKKGALTVCVIGGALIGIIFQFIGLPANVMAIGQLLTISKTRLLIVTFPTTVLVLMIPAIFTILLILGAYLIKQPFSKPHVIQLILAVMITEIILLIAYLRGMIELALADLELAELMLINMSMGIMISVAIIIAAVLIVRIQKVTKFEMG